MIMQPKVLKRGLEEKLQFQKLLLLKLYHQTIQEAKIDETENVYTIVLEIEVENEEVIEEQGEENVDYSISPEYVEEQRTKNENVEEVLEEIPRIWSSDGNANAKQRSMIAIVRGNESQWGDSQGTIVIRGPSKMSKS